MFVLDRITMYDRIVKLSCKYDGAHMNSWIVIREAGIISKFRLCEVLNGINENLKGYKNLHILVVQLLSVENFLNFVYVQTTLIYVTGDKLTKIINDCLVRWHRSNEGMTYYHSFGMSRLIHLYIVLTRLKLAAINSFSLLGLVRKLRLEKEMICWDYQKHISYVITFSYQNVILSNWIDIFFYCMTRIYHWPNFLTFYWLSLIPISNIERCFYFKKKRANG